jgi:hypothetical protein
MRGGAPRIHGELLKLGIEISQATVAKYMLRRRETPSPTWRSFLSNQAQGIAAIDMFVVASISFRLLYVMIILGHDRREIIRAAVTEHPTAAWLSRQVTEAFPWDTAPRSPWQNPYVERVTGSCCDLQRTTSAPRVAFLRRLLPSNAHPSFAR